MIAHLPLPGRRSVLSRLARTCLLAASGPLACFADPAAPATPPARRIPVILDSDIGDDIDDTWALGFLLRCPELDLKLVVGDQGRVDYRAKLLAKFLERAGRTDVPIGLGIDAGRKGVGGQASWVADYELSRYPGQIHKDGIQAIIDTIMKSPEPVTVIAIGPLPNIGVALEREPRIAEKARFVGMHGSVRVGYGGNRKEISAEYNVKAAVKACQQAFTAPWDMTITPLDTCGLVHLRGGKYQQVYQSRDPIAAAVIENYRIWSKARKNDVSDRVSSTLFDTVAVYLAFDQALCKMEDLGIRVDDEGYTRIDPEAKQVHVAADWRDMGAFEDLLVARLTNGQ